MDCYGSSEILQTGKIQRVQHTWRLREVLCVQHTGKTLPLWLTPFAGGGAIPLEALRLSCDASASDLNPVATLILKVTLDDIPRSGFSLPAELNRAGDDINAALEKELSNVYKSGSGGQPISYLWSRTVICDSCGTEIPLMRSFWLSKKPSRKRALRYKIVRSKGTHAEIAFEIFQPRNDSEVAKGTVANGKAACLACNVVMPAPRVKVQLRVSSGSKMSCSTEPGCV